jgi:antitoxin HigA-1
MIRNMANNKILEKDPDLKPIHPGEILREEFLIPLAIEPEELARNIGVEEKIIKELIEEKTNIDFSLSYRLGLYFDLRDDY